MTGWLGRASAMAALVGLLLPLAANPARALEASVVARDVTPPIGVPLAGYTARRKLLPDFTNKHPYAHWFEPSTGTLEPIRAKVLVIRDGAEKLAFVSLDLVGVSRELRADILARLPQLGVGFGDDEFFVSATHTHSGPGALTDNGLFERTATDRFAPAIHDAFVGAVAEAVADAVGSLQSAKLERLGFNAVDIQKNRRDPAADVDARANLLLVQASGILSPPWLGAMVNLGVHATALKADNLQYSGDLPGAIERAVGDWLGSQNPDGAPVPVLFINGAEGDVKPFNSDYETLGQAFATQAAAHFDASGTQTVTADWEVEQRSVVIHNAFFYLKSQAPGWLQPLVWSRYGLSLRRWFPQEARIWSIRLGDMRLMTWPGEATAALGAKLHGAAAAAGAADLGQSWVLGLTNDHLAYFTTPEEFEAREGTAARSAVYGPWAGLKILNAHCELLDCP